MILDLRHHRKTIIIAIFFIIGLSLLLLSTKKFSSDITDMLPEGSSASKMLKHLQEENISGRITVELRLKENYSNLELLPKSVTQLKASLKHSEIISVFTGFAIPGEDTLAEAYTALPQLANKADMAKVAEMTSSGAITQSMSRNYILLASPGGIGLYSFIEKDPLGLNRIVLKKLELFSNIITYKTAPGSTILIGPDQRRALVIIESFIPVTDSKRASAFLSYLDNELKKLPAQISSSVMSGHKHTIGNEKVIARDIVTVSIASLVIFVLLFALIYRCNPSSFSIILMPLLAVLVSVTIMAILINHVSAFVIGLGGVMAGISVDYGIHVYALCCDDSDGENRRKKITKIARPLCAGALTTMAIFVAFLFADVSMYTQLGIFAIICIVLSLAMSLYILPNLLPDKGRASLIRMSTPALSYRGALTIVILWALIIGTSATIALSSSFFDSSVTSLDAAGDDVINAEKDFNDYWSKREMPAILSVKGDNREETFQSAEMLADNANEYKLEGFVSPVTLIPSDKTMQFNRNNWHEFWTPERINKTTSEIISAGMNKGFKEDAFATFNSWLSSSLNDLESKCKLFTYIMEKLLKHNGDKWTLTSFMSDTPANLNIIEKIQQKIPDLRVISPSTLRDSIGTEVLGRLQIIGMASLIIVLLLSIITSGGLITGIIALLPVVTAIIVICGFSGALNIPLTIPSCVAIIIIIGLSIDYGIFMVFHSFKNLKDDVMTAITLCAVTTSAGAATLLFALHPVMFKLGMTLLAGIIVSYTATVTLIPALAVLIKRKDKSLIKLSLVFLAIIGISGCSMYNTLPELAPLLSFPAPKVYNPPDKQWSTVSFLTFYVFGQQDSLLCAAQFNAVNDSGSIVCIQPSGIKVLEAQFDGDKISHEFLIPELKKQGLKVEDVVRDIKRISFGNKFADMPGIVYDFDKDTTMLRTKKFIKNDRCVWEISYRQYKLIDGYSVPLEMRLDNFSPKYSLLIKVKEFSEIPPKYGQ